MHLKTYWSEYTEFFIDNLLVRIHVTTCWSESAEFFIDNLLVRIHLTTYWSESTEFFIDNLQARIHFIIEMIWWTGLAPWVFEFPFPGSLVSTFLVGP